MPRLNYGTMDAGGVIYVNLFGTAGLRAGVELLQAHDQRKEAARVRANLLNYRSAVDRLLQLVNGNVGWDERGLCCVLWPCGYDGLSSTPIQVARTPSPGRLPKLMRPLLYRLHLRMEPWSRSASIWPYLDMDYAHNAMFAGDRAAAFRTIERYLNTPSFRTWATLDEGGESDSGYWGLLLRDPELDDRVAMPHGWSLASLFALIRDSIVYESRGSCVVLAGIPPDWFAEGRRIHFRLPTEFGRIDFTLKCRHNSADVLIEPGCAPPKGFVVKVVGADGELSLKIPKSPTPGRAVHKRFPVHWAPQPSG